MGQLQAAELVVRGGGLHAQGKLHDALQLFEEAIASNPGHADAFAGRGDVLTDLGNYDLSIASYDRAIELAPGRAEFHDYRGIAFARMGQLEDALESLDRALALDPENLNAMNNRANVLKLMKRPQDALGQIDRVISALPQFAAAHNNRGNALIELGRLNDATESFDRALELEPGQVDVMNNRVTALIKAGRLDDAIVAYRDVLALDPDKVDSLQNIADLLVAKGQTMEAIGWLRRATSLTPDDVEALTLLSFLLANQRQMEEAIDCCQRILELDKDNFAALTNLGGALAASGRLNEALTSFNRAIEVEPGNSLAHFNRGWLLREGRKYDDALESMDRCLEINSKQRLALETRLGLAMQLARWDKVESQRDQLRELIKNGTEVVTPFPILAAIDEPDLHLKCAKAYAEDNWGSKTHTKFTWPFREGRIRVGYFSADFYAHATLFLMLETLQAHDRNKFEWFGISFGPPLDDNWRRAVEDTFSTFVDIKFTSDEEAVKIVRDMKLDIAVDLKGYTANLRTGLFAERVAPVQVNYLGYPGTLGVDWMDYVIADRVLIPEERKQFYAEKIAYLPGCYQPNSPAEANPITTLRADHDLPADGFVFCSFNNTFKIWPETFAVWMRILSRVEKSVLWLWVDTESARRNFRDEASRAGISEDRIIFAAKANRDDHLVRLQCADLFLDTLPYNAHTTASDALRIGLPLLTCPGRAFAGRVAASLLTTLDLPELIVSDMAQYEELAIALAQDAERLARIKATLKRNVASSTLFDPVDAARKLEAAYEAMYERSRAGLSADHIYL